MAHIIINFKKSKILRTMLGTIQEPLDSARILLSPLYYSTVVTFSMNSTISGSYLCSANERNQKNLNCQLLGTITRLKGVLSGSSH